MSLLRGSSRRTVGMTCVRASGRSWARHGSTGCGSTRTKIAKVGNNPSSATQAHDSPFCSNSVVKFLTPSSRISRSEAESRPAVGFQLSRLARTSNSRSCKCCLRGQDAASFAGLSPLEPTHARLSCRCASGGSLKSAEHPGFCCCCSTVTSLLNFSSKHHIHSQIDSGDVDSVARDPLTTTPGHPSGNELETPRTTAAWPHQYAANEKNQQIRVGRASHAQRAVQ